MLKQIILIKWLLNDILDPSTGSSGGFSNLNVLNNCFNIQYIIILSFGDFDMLQSTLSLQRRTLSLSSTQYGFA